MAISALFIMVARDRLRNTPAKGFTPAARPSSATGPSPAIELPFFSEQLCCGLSRLPRVLFAAGLFLAVVAGLCAAWDHELSIWLSHLDVPGDLRKGIELSEAFAHGLGAAVILLAVLVTSPQRRMAIWLAVLITVSSGIVANGLKGAFVRVRPHSQSVIAVAGEKNQVGTRDSSGRELVEASFWDARQRSFPSGHAATAWGLMIGLSVAFPRGIWLFGVLAVMASYQRILSGAHFPSDVAAGASIACVTAGLLVLAGQLRAGALTQDPGDCTHELQIKISA